VAVSCWICANSATKSMGGCGAGSGAAGAGAGGTLGGIPKGSGVGWRRRVGVGGNDVGKRGGGGVNDESPNTAKGSGGGEGVRAREDEKTDRERGSSPSEF
jgi:hypothetical protein